MNVRAIAVSLDSVLQHAGDAVTEHTARLAVTRDGTCMLRGTGTALGERSRWALHWGGQRSTSFAEVCDLAALRNLCLRSGHDAETGDTFQTDLSRCTIHLHPGDDAHARSLLTTWVRTGQWVHAVGAGLLHAELCTSQSGGKGAQKGKPRGGVCVVALSVQGSGAPVAKLFLDQVTYVPVRMELQVHSGGVETWTWSRWPADAVHVQSSGQETIYTAALDSSTDNEDHVALSQLLLPPPPIDSSAAFTTATIPAARSNGGQFLLRATALPDAGAVASSPHEGWYVLDPCCDGCAISQHVGDAMAWPSAGHQQMHALGGPAAGPLLQRAIALGSCVLPSHAWHQQLALDGALAGIPHGQPLAGVLGMSLLRRCLLEVRAHARVPGSRDAPVTEVLVHQPGSFVDPNDRTTVSWQRLRFLDGAPHVECTLWLYDDSDGDGSSELNPGSTEALEVPFSGWFRLGLGIGGTALILSATTAASMNFADTTQALQPQGVLAGPGEQRGRFVAAQEGGLLSGRLPRVSLRGASFVRQRAVVHTTRDGSLRPMVPPDLQLSDMAAGVLCADLFRGCTILLDVPGARCAVIKQAQK